MIGNGLDRENSAAHLSPGKPRGHTGLCGLGKFLFEEDRLSQVVGNVLLPDFDGKLRIPFYAFPRDLSVDLVQGLLEIPQPRLPSIAVRDGVERCGVVLDAALRQARPLQRFRYEVFAGNGHFLLVDIAGKPDDLHAVQKRARGWSPACWPW